LVIATNPAKRGSEGVRTLDSRGHNPVLYQLSYAHRMSTTARLAGLEPATTGLEVRCSIQLSYRRQPPG
jgi:hypothetical protein